MILDCASAIGDDQMNEPNDFGRWLASCRMVGPRELRKGVPGTVESAIDRFRSGLSGETPETVSMDTLDELSFESSTDAWSAYLFLRYLGRYDVLPAFNKYLASKYSQNKKVQQIVKSFDLDGDYTKRLSGKGIRMAMDILHRGWNADLRRQVADETDIPHEDLLTIVKGCDICRMTGMLGKTLFRCRAMGYRTMEDFRRVTAEELKASLEAYLEEHGERTSAMIDYAWFANESRRFPDLVEY